MFLTRNAAFSFRVSVSVSAICQVSLRVYVDGEVAPSVYGPVGILHGQRGWHAHAMQCNAMQCNIMSNE